MLPTFESSTLNALRSAIPSFAAIEDAAGNRTRGYESVFRGVARKLRSTGRKVESLRTAYRATWANYLYANHEVVAPVRSGDFTPDSELTPAELELTRKALLAGVTHTELAAIPIEHVGSADGDLSGRWLRLVDAVFDFGADHVSGDRRSIVLGEYWLQFMAPNATDKLPVTKVSTLDDEGLLDYALRSRAGVSVLHIQGTKYASFMPRERSSACCLPLFGYIGSSLLGCGGGTLIALHHPNVAQLFPKRPFLAAGSTMTESQASCWAHAAAQTILITDRSDLNAPVSLAGSHFPMSFAGPHAASRYFRAVSLLQQLTSYQFRSPVANIAAHLGADAVGSHDRELRTAIVGKASVLLTQPEYFFGLCMDRGAAISLSGTAAENNERVRTLLDHLDKTVQSLDS